MLVMPLRITHVDTKVLVLLVQAMPTSLHAAQPAVSPRIAAQGDNFPDRHTQRKKENQARIKLFLASAQRCKKCQAQSAYFKSAAGLFVTLLKDR